MRNLKNIINNLMGFMKQTLIKAGFEKIKAEKILKSDKPGAYEKKPLKGK